MSEEEYQKLLEELRDLEVRYLFEPDEDGEIFDRIGNIQRRLIKANREF